MPNWLSLLIIVLVSVAVFADLRRPSVEKPADLAGDKDLNATPDHRGDVRGVGPYGRPASMRPSRGIPARRAGSDVSKRR